MFSLSSLISCFVPIFTGRYWFITIYFGLYLVSPFLNILIRGMDQKLHFTLNALLFVLMSVMVSVFPTFKGMNSGAGWGLAWFVTLYLAAAWFRLYYQPNGRCTVKLLIWVGMAATVMIIYEVGGVIPVIRNVAANWYRYDSAPAYIMSLLVFVGFLNVRIEKKIIKKTITLLAPTTFGVYLIHAHADFSPWSWEVLNLPQKMELMVFPEIQIAVVVGIFLFCAVIDIVRRNTFGRFEKNALLQKMCSKVQDRFFDFLIE